MVQKKHILLEIRRTAETNGGVPLGVARFYAETGIKETDWRGKYWLRWGDALSEAGYEPNALQGAYDEEELIEQFIGLVREVGRYPLQAEIKMKRRQDESFASHNVFRRRFGNKGQFARRIIAYCAENPGFEDVPKLVEEAVENESAVEEEPQQAETEDGFVYLLKSGKNYKIGRTNSLGRRERELAIQLPTKATRVHAIKTDDPVGIEKYWHQRFTSKHLNGEWYALEAKDVAAFKRRKFM